MVHNWLTFNVKHDTVFNKYFKGLYNSSLLSTSNNIDTLVCNNGIIIDYMKFMNNNHNTVEFKKSDNLIGQYCFGHVGPLIGKGDKLPISSRTICKKGKGMVEIEIWGTFCGIKCMLSYLKYSAKFNSESYQLIRYLWGLKFPGKTFPKCPPHYSNLNIHGGNLSIEDYLSETIMSDIKFYSSVQFIGSSNGYSTLK